MTCMINSTAEIDEDYAIEKMDYVQNYDAQKCTPANNSKDPIDYGVGELDEEKYRNLKLGNFALEQASTEHRIFWSILGRLSHSSAFDAPHPEVPNQIRLSDRDFPLHSVQLTDPPLRSTPRISGDICRSFSNGDV